LVNLVRVSFLSAREHHAIPARRSSINWVSFLTNFAALVPLLKCPARTNTSLMVFPRFLLQVSFPWPFEDPFPPLLSFPDAIVGPPAASPNNGPRENPLSPGGLFSPQFFAPPLSTCFSPDSILLQHEPFPQPDSLLLLPLHPVAVNCILRPLSLFLFRGTLFLLCHDGGHLG